MPNPYGAPEITAPALKALADGGEPFLWLDVREPWEFRRVHVNDARVQLVPLSALGEQQTAALPDAMQAGTLDKRTPVVVQCHHGVRSAQVALWLRQHGWSNAVSLAGGVAAWAAEVDPAIGTY